MWSLYLESALFISLLLLGTASAQAPSETLLLIAPSAIKGLEASGFRFPPSAAEGSLPQGQSETVPPPERGVVALFERGVRDQKDIYSASFHRRNLKWGTLFLAATGGLISADRHVTGAISHNNLSVSQHISDVGLYSTVAATGLMLFSGMLEKNEHAKETGLLGFEAFANTLAVGAVTQLIAGRERPLEGVGHGRFWVNNTVDSSFPSLHSGLTWSMASVVAHEYPRPWVQILVYGTATTVSVTRVTGLKHFPADVAVGGVFGYLIGQHIFHAHPRLLHPRNDLRAHSKANVELLAWK